MLDKVKHTLRHTAVYSIGNLATKFIGVMLLPLYVRHLSVAEYGLFGILEITIQICAQSLSFGQPQAVLRFYDMEEYRDRRRPVVATLLAFLLFIGFLILLGGRTASGPLSRLFARPEEFAVYFQVCSVVVFLRILNLFSLSVIRAREKSLFYVIVNVVKLCTILGLSLYFVLHAGLAVKGLLYAYMIGEGVLFVLLIPVMVPETAMRFDRAVFRDAFVFGAPLVLGGLANMLLDVGDRYLLKLLVNYKEAGLYHLGYRIASVLNVFLVIPFRMGWMPISYRLYGRDGDRRYYTKMLTYFMFVLVWAGLGLSLFYREILSLFAKNTEYWAAVSVVPVIVLSYVINGGRTVLNLGLYLTQKTKYIATNTVAAVVLNVGLNFLLIPRFRMMGAAAATLASVLALYLLTLWTANRCYRVPYEHLKIVMMVVAGVGLYGLASAFEGLPLGWKLVAKSGTLLAFPLLLRVFGFYEKIEIDTLKKLFHREIP